MRGSPSECGLSPPCAGLATRDAPRKRLRGLYTRGIVREAYRSVFFERRPEPQHGTPFHPVNVLRVVPGHEKWHEPECQANVCSAFAPPSLVDTSSTVLYQYFS